MRIACVVGLLACACAGPSYVAGLRAPLKVSSDVAHAEDHFEGARKTRLFWQSWKPAKGKAKAALVIVHGLKDHSDRYADAAEKLTRRGYAVYAMDLRGHGDSEGDRVWVASFSEYEDDLYAFLKRVRADAGELPLFLFGHSMGGQIVVRYAIDHQPALAGLITSAPAIKPTPETGGALIGATRVLGSITPTLAVFQLKDEDFSRDPKVVEEMKTDPLVYDKPAPAHTAAELLESMDFTAHHFGDVHVPLFAMHGTADHVTNPDGSKDLVDGAGTSDKTLKLYDGLVHDLLHEPEKDKVLNDMAAWMDAHAHGPRHASQTSASAMAAGTD